MFSVSIQRQLIDLDNCRHFQISVQVRKQDAAARGLPFQFVSQHVRIDAQQHKIPLARPVLGRTGDDLLCTAEMNEAIRQILG